MLKERQTYQIKNHLLANNNANNKKQRDPLQSNNAETNATNYYRTTQILQDNATNNSRTMQRLRTTPLQSNNVENNATDY